MIEVERVVELRRQGVSWRAIAQQLGVSQAGVRKAAVRLVHTPDGLTDAGGCAPSLVGELTPPGGDSVGEPRSRLGPIPGARPWAEGVSLKQSYPCAACGTVIAQGEKHAVRIDGGKPRPRLCADCHDSHAAELVGWPLLEGVA